MATPAKKSPLGDRPAQKRAASPRVGALERSVNQAITAANKAKSLTSPWDIVTAEILKSVAKAADKALKDGERAEFKTLVDKMREVLVELDPRGGVSNDDDGDGDHVDRALAEILRAGPEVRNT